MTVRNITTIAMGCLAILLAACNSDSQKPKAAADPTRPAPPSSTPTAMAPKPEVYLYLSQVDNLLLRSQPTQQGSQVITKFKMGEFVEGAGEMSSNKESATIRGIEMTEPYVKVTSTTPDRKSGWAFGGALQCVYAGPRAGSPELGKLNQLANTLKPLSTKKLDSAKRAWTYVQANLSGATGSLADATFIILEGFLSRLETEGQFYTMTEKIDWSQDDYGAIHEDRFDMNKYPATKTLADNGFRLETAEGMVYPIVDWQKFQDFFASKATPPMRAFIEQSAKEQKDQIYDDGGIVIPLEEVVNRAIFWERFNLANPHFVQADQTRESQRWLTFSLTNGSDNTPVFDYEKQTVTEDFQKVWAYVQQQYPGTQVAATIKEMADLVAAEGGKRTKKVEDFQMKRAEEQAK